MRRRQKLTLKGQAQLCETFSSLLAAGFTLAQAIDYGRTLRPKEAAQLAIVAEALSAGEDVTQAFSAGGFSAAVCTQIGLAGRHGNLTATLHALGQYLQLLQTTRSRVGQLLTYPLTLLILLTVLQGGIVYWILPQLTSRPGQSLLPQLVFCTVVFCFVMMAIYIVKHLDANRRYQLFRHVPVAGGMIRQYYQYEFVLGAASFLSAGRDLADYCGFLALHGQGPLALLGEQVADAVSDGEPLRVALDKPLVPLGFVQLAEMGQTPHLFSQSVATYARGLFSELELQLNRLLGFVQPVLFLVLGVQIVMMYARLLLPLYSMIGAD